MDLTGGIFYLRKGESMEYPTTRDSRDITLELIQRLGIWAVEGDYMQVDICNFCGCLHKSSLHGICSSCADAVVKVQVEQAIHRMNERLVQCGKSFSTLHAAMRLATEGAFGAFGAFGQMEISTASIPLSSFREDHNRMVIYESSHFVTHPCEAIRPMKMPPLFGYSEESEKYKRLARMKHRGPEKRGAWWNGKRRW